ncbi:MAG: Threonylcarbamoyl-AMP synthase [Candidatus Dichloromethanomonas elyunquensis]|nr:MAG: Threonylcarbamoyl-AMP synthase [Candidatus Dichloromethanomonas elyunquensis]
METNFQTRMLTIEEGLSDAVQLLRQGEVVAFPTETVYGLGANALDPKACKKIFKIKGRPADNPLIVHIASVKDAKKIVREWTDAAKMCAEAFWPGPLTLVLPKSRIIPDIVSAGLNTVAVRMPAHPAALELIRAAGVPLAAPSANISGKPSPTEGKHVRQDLKGRIPLVIDAGKCSIGLESTVLDLSGKTPVILRPGGVTKEQLETVLGTVEIEREMGESREAFIPSKSPGMKYRHYAPNGEIILIKSADHKKAEKIAGWVAQKKSGNKMALICMEETKGLLSTNDLEGIDFLFVLGSVNRPQEAASHLFEALRSCDEEKINFILAEEMPEEGIGLAFMNRLRKAAGESGFVDPGKI